MERKYPGTDGPEATPELHGGAQGLDRRALASIRALDSPGSSAVLERVIGIYMKNTPKLMLAMRAAADAGDAAALASAAHALKSGSLYIGAARVGALCREIEAAARSAPADIRAELVAAAESEYLRVEQWLRAELAPGGA